MTFQRLILLYLTVRNTALGIEFLACQLNDAIFTSYIYTDTTLWHLKPKGYTSTISCIGIESLRGLQTR